MRYINPFSILEFLGLEPTETLNPQSLRRLKRQLLTEFELQESTTIKVNNNEMDKNAVLETFEELEDETLFAYHLIIFKHTFLKRFLEFGSLRFFRLNLTKTFFAQYQDNKGFIEYIRPYFSAQFDIAFYSAILQKDKITRLLSNEAAFFPHQYEGDCFKMAYRTLIQDVDHLGDMKPINRQKIKKINLYFTDKYVIFFNLLPDYFFDVRIKLGQHLEEIALSVNNELGDTRLAKHILAQGLQYKTNESTRYRLQYILDQLNSYPEEEWGNGTPTTTPHSFKSNSNHWWIILIVCILGVIYFAYILNSVFGIDGNGNH